MADDRDAFDHAAHHLAEGGAVRPNRVAQEAFDLVAHRLDRGFDLAGDLGRFRGDCVVDGLDFGFQPFLLRLQLAELGDQGGIVPGVDDRTNDTRGLRLRSLQSGLEFRRFAIRSGERFLAICDRFGAYARQRRLVHPLMAIRVADNPLQIGALDQLALRACPFRSDVAATVVFSVAHGESRAAFAAVDQTGKQVLRAMGAVEGDAVLVPSHLRADLGLFGLDALPKRVVHDPQGLVAGFLPLVFRIRAGCASAGARVADVGAAVPDEAPDIKLVVQETVPRSAWPRMVVSIQGRPRGPGTLSLFKVAAIALGEAPLA